MADYNTGASFEFEVSSLEAITYAEELYENGVTDEGREEAWGFRAAFKETEKTIWISSADDSFDVEHAVEFVQLVLTKDESKAVVFFEWANTCTKPRLDGFGGGAVAVSADDAEWIIPSQLRDKAIAALTLRREVAEVMAAREFDEDELEDLVENQKDNLMDGINGGGVESQIEFLLSQDSNIKATLIKLVKASPGVTPKG